MALIVEDGTGLPDAESYVSVTDADEYHSARGNAAWTGSEAVKEQALRRATAYLDGRYGRQWPGTRVLGREQRLSWPRVNASDVTGEVIAGTEVPFEVVQATCEAALRALSGPLVTDLSIAQQRIKRQKIDVIETEFDLSPAAGSALPVITVIDQLLASLIRPVSLTLTGTVARG